MSISYENLSSKSPCYPQRTLEDPEEFGKNEMLIGNTGKDLTKVKRGMSAETYLEVKAVEKF